MNWRTCGLLALGLAAACRGAGAPTATLPERVRIGGVSWYVDYDAAVEVAREADKALWVHFGENPG
jgi:hypothetical protein